MQTPTSSSVENLRYIAAGLMAAAGAHLLLCVATMPGLMAAPAAGFAGVAFKAAKILWTLAGIAGAAFVGGHAFSVLSARSHAKARVAALGAIVLPLMATNGVITAFALVPVGVLTLVLLRQPQFRAAFADGTAEIETGTPESGATPASGRQPAWPVAG